MDSSRVSLVTLLLRADSFGGSFQCDRSLTLGFPPITIHSLHTCFFFWFRFNSGVNLKALTKLLKTAANDDQTTLRVDDDANSLVVVIDSPSFSFYS
jgi:hypothetical protein